MQIGNNIALWGMLGMLVPLLIHLFSKQRQKEVYFGTIRFLEATSSQKARTLHLSEYGLLALRMLIIGILTIIIAQPFVKKKAFKTKVYIPFQLVENSMYASVTNQYIKEDHQIIAYRHPYEEACKDCMTYASINTLIVELNRNQDSTVLFSYGLYRDVRGSLPDISSQITIHQIPYANYKEDSSAFVIGDSLYSMSISEVNSNIGLNLETEGISTNKTEEIRICIKGAQKSTNYVNRISEIINSLRPFVRYPIVYQCENYNWLFAIDTSIANAGSSQITWSSQDSEFRWSHLSSQDYKIEGNLREREIRKSNLPLLLVDLLTSTQSKIERFDFRTISFQDIASYEPVKKEIKEEYASVQKYWWILLVLLLFGERMISFRRQDKG